MNISFTLSPTTSVELDAMLTVLSKHGIQADSVSIPRRAAPIVSDSWESKWKQANPIPPGKRAPVFTSRMKEKYGDRENFFQALMEGGEASDETEETETDSNPISPAAMGDVDESDI